MHIVDGFTITNGNGNNYMGGAMYFVSGTPTIKNCIMTGNSTNYGGGAVALMGSASPSFDNCLITNNTAYSFGGGVYCYATGATPTFVNCTIADNHGSFGGGIFNAWSNLTMNNCIIWGNTDNIHIADQIRNQSGTFTLNNCCYADGWGNVYGTVIANNCITSDPLFVDAEGDDYHLKIGSPCIDAGDSALIPEGVTEDLDGRQRVWGANVDMGPYEGGITFVPSIYPAIQDALSAASDGDVILVENGTYSGPDNCNLDFGGKSIHLKSVGGPKLCIIDCSSQGSVFNDQEDPNAILDGFTFQNGSAQCGGGIQCIDGSNPTITNCIITNNSASMSGGGICCKNSSPTITNCIITGNSAVYSGGGIYCYNSQAIISNCVIRGNSAGSNYNGGGIYCDGPPVVTEIINCVIADNTAGGGAGVFCNGGSTPAITNCEIWNNSANWGGGGVFARASANPTITNCTIADNTAVEYGGGFFAVMSAAATLNNTIIWGNSAGQGNQIYTMRVATAIPHVTLNYCDYSNASGDVEGDGILTESNCIHQDPLFNGFGDYRLASRISPCVDAGNNILVPSGVNEDLDGNLRIVWDSVDIGAYEYPYPAPVAYDDRGFILLSHPFFEERYGVTYQPELIPPALDIIEVTLEREGGCWKFTIFTAGNIQELFMTHPNEAQFSLFFDTDCSNLSDCSMYTLPGGSEAVVVTSDFTYLDTLGTEVLANTLTVLVPESVIGDDFDWWACSRFTIPPGLPLATPLADVSISPVVDIAYFQPDASIFMSRLITELSEPEAEEENIASQICKTEDDKEVDLDGDGTKEKIDIDEDGTEDWPDEIESIEWEEEGETVKVAVQRWIIDVTPGAHSTSSDYYAILVFNDPNGNGKKDPGEEGGWIARCPYEAAKSSEGPEKHLKGTKLTVKITVADKADSDHDNMNDQMTYEYDHSTGKLKVTNKETPAAGGPAQETSNTYDKPFSKPGDVPGEKEDWVGD